MKLENNYKTKASSEMAVLLNVMAIYNLRSKSQYLSGS